MLKKIILFLFILAIGITGWYLFIKKYDYTLNFTVNNSVSQVFYETGDLRNFGLEPQKDKISRIAAKEYKSLDQKILQNQQPAILLNWQFDPIDTSKTAISLNFTSERNKLKNRLQILNPFQDNKLVDSVKLYITTFVKSVKNKKATYKIEINEGVAQTPSQFCICNTSKAIPASQKALEMVSTIDILEDYFLNNNLERDGYPFVKVTFWDRSTDLIDFDFCYPVKPKDSLPKDPNVQLKQFKTENAMKAIFNGNYRMSHLAWQEMLYEASKSEKVLKLKPMEVFYNNPNTDTEPLKWKADIFMPLE
ncbi:hypothetical protein [Gramella sp. AN32]|uniref:Uncharacterized protein n=1 Tax=Christiangramia antarctica TaxID=2058158 RepID=A0ABW5XAH7_9FLAO|nr:hypothetical protein [Gramella sp. AN32]MCM4156555.1 hypothetical protein [Gramella sp. AN32]